MALSKSTTTNQGVVATYWKITNAKINKNNMVASWSLGLFLSQTIADAGNVPPFLVRQYSASITKTQALGDLVALGYATIIAKDVTPPAPPAPKKGRPAQKQDQTLVGATNI